MFKGEYQGGPSVDVFSAQGREALSKKCKVTGSSSYIHKEYDKDVKSYVYVLEGEPTTTRIQFPKEDKHGLFLTQKFLVFQLFLPTGRSFSFEIAVTDQGQNKRRIFFSSNLKDISVTPLHAKFPLTTLKLGSWLNMCLDLESLVNDTFNGPKFRAVESFTVTANCRLKKVFTLRAPPTSEDQNLEVPYTNAEPLPRNLQMITTSNVSTITQILSYMTLCRKPCEMPNTPLSTPSNHDGTTPRQDQETHIAFGTKVVIPPHLRRNSLKENRESSMISQTSRLSSSKTKHGQSAPDVRNANEDIVKSPSSIKENQDGKSSDSTRKGIDASQATIQPRPPRTSSAGKIRRPIRLKSSSAGKTRTSGKVDNSLGANSEKNCPEEINVEVPEISDSSKAIGIKTSLQSISIVKDEQDEKTVDTIRSFISNSEKLTVEQTFHSGIENDPNSSGTNTDTLSQEPSVNNGHVGLLFEDRFTNEQNDGCSEIQEENSDERAEQMAGDNHTDKVTPLSNIVKKSSNSSDNVIEDTKNTDMNNNDALADKDQPRIRPRRLPLASNNPVFTFASMPRSPRSGKRKLLDSPMVDDVITPDVEAPPEVIVSLTEDAIVKNPVRNTGQNERNRGASLEDDFCKLSDEDDHDEDTDGIQKLLQSSLSPRHSPMPFHHQLRQSIKSSMLKEIPSPVKENGYDAQNYQSDNHLDTLNQSTASSWRFDTSDSCSSFNQTQQDLEDSLDDTSFPKAVRHITAIADIPVVDDNDEDGHSDCSDDTTCSAWRTPPQDMRGNKYQNEMKPLGQEPDLTATMDPRDYCDVFSPPIVLGTPNKENNSAISNLSPLKSPYKFPANQEEEELDLLYDPCLNCYFDPTTHKYYELA